MLSKFSITFRIEAPYVLPLEVFDDDLQKVVDADAYEQALDEIDEAVRNCEGAELEWEYGPFNPWVVLTVRLDCLDEALDKLGRHFCADALREASLLEFSETAGYEVRAEFSDSYSCQSVDGIIEVLLEEAEPAYRQPVSITA